MKPQKNVSIKTLMGSYKRETVKITCLFSFSLQQQTPVKTLFSLNWQTHTCKCFSCRKLSFTKLLSMIENAARYLVRGFRRTNPIYVSILCWQKKPNQTMKSRNDKNRKRKCLQCKQWERKFFLFPLSVSLKMSMFSTVIWYSRCSGGATRKQTD